MSLVGQSAPPEVLQKLTYLVIRHPQVKRIDTVRAYTFGVLYFVEVGHFVYSETVESYLPLGPIFHLKVSLSTSSVIILDFRS